MAGWTKTKATSISRKLDNVLKELEKVNADNERIKHSFLGADLSRHAEAMAATRGLWGVKGTFDRMAGALGRKKR